MSMLLMFEFRTAVQSYFYISADLNVLQIICLIASTYLERHSHTYHYIVSVFESSL